MKKLLIIGASGHGKVLANIAYESKKWEEISFLDDDIDKVGSDILNFRVIERTLDIKKYIADYEFIVGIGDSNSREKITIYLKNMGARITTLIHPSAIIGLDVEIGQGSVVMPMCVINASSNIGEGCIINTGTTVDHDCKLESFVHLSPGVSLGGNVKIKRNTWVGMGAKVINNINITNDCVIGSGAVVISNLDSPGIYVGVPSRFKSERKNYEKIMDY